MKIASVVTLSEAPHVFAFYQECNAGYNDRTVMEALQNGTVLAVKEETEIVGIVRLCIEQNVLVLRSMQVAPLRKKQGIGTLLLEEVVQRLEGRPCWGIPYQHLEKFYGRAGFVFLKDESGAPPHLLQRIAHYRHTTEHRYAIMYRPPSPG